MRVQQGEFVMNFLINYYSWLKAFHLICAFAWMAGLFYLPRLFVYNSQVDPDSQADNLFIVMQGRLIKIIMLPAMIGCYVFGAGILCTPGIFASAGAWLHWKLFLVFLLTIYQHLLGRFHKNFVLKQRVHSENFFRIINEIPTILLIGIVIMAVIRPC